MDTRRRASDRLLAAGNSRGDGADVALRHDLGVRGRALRQARAEVGAGGDGGVVRRLAARDAAVGTRLGRRPRSARAAS